MVVDLTQTFEYKRQEFYNKHNIDFSFFKEDYGLRQYPIERRSIPFKKSLDYYCIMVRELRDNIQLAIDSKENDYFSKDALVRFNAILPNWETKIKSLEDFIYSYYKRITVVNGEFNEQEKA